MNCPHCNAEIKITDLAEGFEDDKAWWALRAGMAIGTLSRAMAMIERMAEGGGHYDIDILRADYRELRQWHRGKARK